MNSYSNRLQEWCQSRMRGDGAQMLLRELFAYDPDKRLTAREALQHKWFEEEPRPSRKYVCEQMAEKTRTFTEGVWTVHSSRYRGIKCRHIDGLRKTRHRR